MRKKRIRALIAAFKKKWGRAPHEGAQTKLGYEPSERRRMKKGTLAYLIAMLLLGAACSTNPKPQPPTPPTPVPCACPAGYHCGDAGVCVPDEPPPDPEPPPTGAHPGEIAFPELELRQPEPPFLVRGGQPFKPFGCNPCCEQVQGTGWPGFSTEFVDECGAFGANMGHFRFGPWFATPETESEWVATGGPYTGNPWEAPTLIFNEPFWVEAHRRVHYAGDKGWNVQAVLIDTWYCKVCQWGTQPCAWPQEDIAACGRRGSPEQRRLIRKVVETIGCDANVIWMTGNESGQIQGATKEWQEWVIREVKQAQGELGCGVDHMIGVDGPEWGDAAGRDYVSTHERAPLTEAVFGVHTENNERNPEFLPGEEHANYCGAQRKGLNWWAWRGGAGKEKWDETRRLIGSGCGSEVGCYAPPAEPGTDWSSPQCTVVNGQQECRPTYTPEQRPTQLRAQLDKAKAAVGDRCGALGPDGSIFGGCLETTELIAAELRKQGLCASGKWVDATAAIAPDGLTEEWHVCSYGNGCYTGNNAYRGAWRYLKENPTPPPPPPACGDPQPPIVWEMRAKEHTKGPDWTTLDATGLVGSKAYCESIGFTDGRVRCPVRMEGAADREACEALSVGTPTWTTKPPGSQPHPTGNPYMLRVPRGTQGPATICAGTVTTICGTVEVTP